MRRALVLGLLGLLPAQLALAARTYWVRKAVQRGSSVRHVTVPVNAPNESVAKAIGQATANRLAAASGDRRHYYDPELVDSRGRARSYTVKVPFRDSGGALRDRTIQVEALDEESAGYIAGGIVFGDAKAAGGSRSQYEPTVLK
jgi:hypothetical protein